DVLAPLHRRHDGEGALEAAGVPLRPVDHGGGRPAVHPRLPARDARGGPTRRLPPEGADRKDPLAAQHGPELASGPAGLEHAGAVERTHVRPDAGRDHLLRHQRPPDEMMPMLERAATIAAALLLAWGGFEGTSSARPQGFRGDGSGRYPGARPPLEWSATKNILWSTKIGPNKYSSPIVVDGRVFLTAEPALLFCVDASDGRILWQRSNGYDDVGPDVQGKPPRGDAGNTTPTPVSDGRFVYAAFGTGIVACYHLKGERR